MMSSERFNILKLHRFMTCLLIAGLILSGCAGGLGNDDRAVTRMTYKMFSTALADIEDVYIESPDLPALTVEALNGLSRIDARISVHWGRDSLILMDGSKEIASTSILPSSGFAELADAATTITMAARHHSRVIAETPIEKVYEVIFGAMTAHLDRFSRYSSSEDASESRAAREGFGGIGISVELVSGEFRISSVLKGHPAAAAGLLTGDRIIAINGRSVEGLELRDVVRLLRGPVNESLRVKLLRDGVAPPLTVTVGRTRIVPNTVFLEINGAIATIHITGFNQRTAKRLAEAVSEARQDTANRLKGIILDLRGNPGGLLEQAVDTADLFLESGMVTETVGRHPLSHQRFVAEPGDVSAGVPIVVLIDGASASAAEILASALQDHGRAVVVGSTSFGKGSVQTVLGMPNEGEIAITWARFLTPKGYVLNGAGILPNICTSGVDDAGEAIDRSFKNDGLAVRRDFAIRRLLNDKDAKAIARFREICPWDPHEGDDVDIETAARLLSQPAAYGRAVTLTVPPLPQG